MKGIIEIKYSISLNDYCVDSNLNYEGLKEVLDSYICCQLGKGEDKSIRNNRDLYNLRLEWKLSNDSLKLISNTNNKGLDLGILLSVFSDFK